MEIKTGIFEILGTLTDPEIPVLTLSDLGVLREVILHDNGQVEVLITPTYTGCPAMDAIAVNVREALRENGYRDVVVRTVLSPAWTTDWLSEEGRQKLKAYGIAPPVGSTDKNALLGREIKVQCPQCDSLNTKLISQFGSTACKALYRCGDCLEPFDYFKCH
jgi:ring-1,2-phenylacetyl-CoA epoxidase subunit PaaD